MHSGFCLGWINRDNASGCHPRSAGMDSFNHWIPAFAGMTTNVLCRLFYHSDLYITGWNDGVAG